MAYTRFYLAPLIFHSLGRHILTIPGNFARYTWEEIPLCSYVNTPFPFVLFFSPTAQQEGGEA